MSDVPLLKELNDMALSCNDNQYCAFIKCYLKTQDALRKYQQVKFYCQENGERCCRICGNGGSILLALNVKGNIRLYCNDCWFKKCFGVLDSQDKKEVDE